MNMGAKRPLEEDDFPELSFKQPKQLDYKNKLILDSENFPFLGNSVTVDSPDEAKSNFCKLQYDGRLDHDDMDGSPIADKELEASAPLSSVTKSGSGEDAGIEGSSFLPYFPRYIDFSLPRRPPEQFEDPYISLLNSSPRKEVPVGPDHQAEIPQLDLNARGKSLSGSDRFVVTDRAQKLMGTCVIPMPGLNGSTISEVRVGRGRTDCSCLDMGSMRCVQQHIKEARENIRETLGQDKFTELGFYDMGEEVASKWTANDERVFREVIFSNPVSHGRNFWKHLSAAFPTRTKVELVSYYFNVFMLRRRAVQNRSHLSEIDSDDDEEQREAHGDFHHNKSFLLDSNVDDVGYDDYDDRQGLLGCSYLVSAEDGDSTFESFTDQDLDAGWIDSWSEPENVYRDMDGDAHRGTSDGNVNKQDDVERDGAKDRTFGQETVKMHGDSTCHS